MQSEDADFSPYFASTRFRPKWIFSKLSGHKCQSSFLKTIFSNRFDNKQDCMGPESLKFRERLPL